MARNSLAGRQSSLAASVCVLGCLLLTSCQPINVIRDAHSCDAECCKEKAKVCTSPTVEALAQDLDTLERHIEKYGSVVAQHPDVWGQARMTKHREDFEVEMYKELGKFTFTLQGSLSRSDTAYLYDSFALSSAAAGAAQSKGKSKSAGSSSAAAVVSTTTGATLPSGDIITSDTSVTKPLSMAKPSSASDGSGGTGSNNAGNGTDPSGNGGGSDNGTGGTGKSGNGGSKGNGGTGNANGDGTVSAQGKSDINVEPEVFLDQKARYINHLNELRRINEGDDTADAPGYALNLVRIPVSILPGKCTDVGHGAEITMTLTPRLSEELLPTTFRNLIHNDLVDQISYPVTQFINNPENSIYFDNSNLHSADLFYDFPRIIFA